MLKKSIPSLVGIALLMSAGAALAETHKWKVNDPALAQSMKDRGGRVLADYGGFQIVETEDALPATAGKERAQAVERFDVIQFSAQRLNTRAPEIQALRKDTGAFAGRRLHLVQFVGPVKPEWRAALQTTGVKIVNYLPQNAYLVQGDAAALARMQAWAGAEGAVQWEGDYQPAYKVHPRARAVAEKGSPRRTGTDTFAIQLIADADANAATLRLIDQWKLAPIRHEYRVLDYHNVIVALPADRLDELAAMPDVISIQPCFEPRKLDERQDQILAGNLAGEAPADPGYLDWLAGLGFTQEQFDASGFVVDVSDSGIDNGTTSPGHFALYRAGNSAQGSRVVYSWLAGTRNSGSTLRGCDGHGNLNAHIIAGYADFAGGFPHTDSAGFNYGLGVCPFVKIGASVVFDPDIFTSPNYTNMLTRAYNSGARISNNSWGMDNGGDYGVDAQAYDALVRDVGSTASNRQMIVVFVAGNSGPAARTISSPGSAKNVITVGGAENVRSLSPANGGNDDSGVDGCGTSDFYADSASDVLSFSSRGPCADGRMKPDLMAPGSHITGGAPQGGSPSTNSTGLALSCFDALSVAALSGGGACASKPTTGNPNNFFPLGQQFYTVSSGTSHAAPAVSGACALLRQYFINHSLAPPSPAMTKAYLMNSARYLTGSGANDTLWSSSQGMGEVDLGAAFDGTARIVRDQVALDTFTATGQARKFTGTIVDPTKPFRVTVAWTDAPGGTATDRALVNDLDLTVVAGGVTYKGNVFSGARSAAGGTADSLNNVESVFLPAGVSGTFMATLSAANIAADGVTLGSSAPQQDFALVIYNATLVPLSVIEADSYALLTEGCDPANGVVDPGETVSVNFTLQNVGTSDTTNLVVTLIQTNGIIGPSGPQSFGALAVGATATQNFSFTAAGSCGGTVTAVFQIADGGANLGTAAIAIPLGTQAPVYAQDFDGVTAGLPVGWTTSASGKQKPWVTSKSAADSLPNSAFSAEAGAIGVNALVSPVIALPPGPAQLSFSSKYNLEANPNEGFDGGVLEIKIGNGSFTDILDADGTFISGGYTHTLSSSYGNPLGGRRAWSGSSGGFITTVVNLPDTAVGQNVQFQWRCGTDRDTSGGGWFIDTIEIKGTWCCPDPRPPAPFVPVAGSYNGLFYETNGIQLQSSGAISLTTTKAGVYSGTLQMGAGKYRFSGQFDAYGAVTNHIVRNVTNDLTLRMQMDTASHDRITGTVSGGTWQAELLANRAVFSAKTRLAPYAGKYTLIFPGSGDAANTSRPLGDGYGVLSVDAGGMIKFSGSLADGTKLTQSAAVSEDGLWPLYLSLYKGQGQLLGWLSFTSGMPRQLGGDFNWIKLPAAAGKYYPLGFNLQTNAMGSAYQAPLTTTNRMLSFSNGVVVLSGGNLTGDINANVTLGSNNKVFNASSNKLTLTLTTSQGSFKGTVPNPATGKAITFNGVVLQNQDTGSGCFLGTNQSGRVFFGSGP